MPEPALYPLGLLNLSDDADGFLGFHFRIEAPLPRQSYTPGGDCLAEWRSVLPSNSATGQLADAHRKLASRIEPSLFDSGRTYTIASRAIPIYPDMLSFRRWIGSLEEDPVPTVIAVVSHHDQNTLFFEDSSPVHADNVARIFLGSSAAILSGCSTGKFGASGLIRSLNLHGVDAIVATNTGISGELAGDFMECFARILETASSPLPIGEVHWHATKCLYEEFTTGGPTPSSRYGPRVLSFTLAGNPHLQFCEGIS
jgi:hypothetical protein